MEVDVQNHRLQELLATAEIAPNPEKLQIDIAKLRSQLSDEQKQQAALVGQIADSQAAITARDKVIGLTDLKTAVQRAMQEAESIARKDANIRSDMAKLDEKVAQAQSKLLKLRAREGQLWLIPDKSATTKEPILVTVAGTGVTIERFDHPDRRKQLDKVGANAAFKSYLRERQSLDQYVVFLVRPSGIDTFQDLVKSARDLGFDVGYDALEEDRQIHFTNPPPVDESTPSTGTSATVPTQKASASNGNSGSPANAPPAAALPKPDKPQPAAAAATSVPAPKKDKSWWQKLLEWVGLR